MPSPETLQFNTAETEESRIETNKHERPEIKIGQQELSMASELERKTPEGYFGKVSGMASNAWEKITHTPGLNFGAGIAQGIYEDIEGVVHIANTARKAAGLTFGEGSTEQTQQSRQELKAMGMAIGGLVRHPIDTVSALAAEHKQVYKDSIENKGAMNLGHLAGKDFYQVASMFVGLGEVGAAVRSVKVGLGLSKEASVAAKIASKTRKVTEAGVSASETVAKSERVAIKEATAAEIIELGAKKSETVAETATVAARTDKIVEREIPVISKKTMPEVRPSFVQDFSKTQLKAERQATAKEIVGSRHEKRALREREFKIAEISKSFNELKGKLDGYDSFYKKVVDFKVYSKLRAQLEKTESNLSRIKAEEIPRNFREPAEIIKRFNKKMAEEWERVPYSKEEAVKYFDAKNLSKLNEEEYVLLLKRFPSSMVTHVTRQGIRDHTGGASHLAGQGEFWDGFKQIAKNRKLENHLSVNAATMRNKDLLATYLGAKPNASKESVMAYLDELTDVEKQHWDGSLADRLSLHTATEEVADAHYGAEKANEIFFAYPSMHIASHRKYQGRLNKAEGGIHNNNWILLDEEGLATDSALVFIPADAKVSAKNGSRYELDADRRAIPDTAAQDKVRELLDNKDFIGYLWDAKNILGERPDKINPADLERLRQEGKKFVVGQPNLEALLDNYQSVFSLSMAAEMPSEVLKNSKIQQELWFAGQYFKPAQEAITSREYWENYFNLHPECRPSKVVYYEGGNPTKALQDWKDKHGLTYNTSSHEDMGLPDNKINLAADVERLPKLLNEIGRFKDLATEAVEEFYANIPENKLGK